jgi:hypothetical protein
MQGLSQEDLALDRALFFFGTFLPAFLASDKPMAIACLRLFTFFPDLPLFSVPSFFSCMARSTFFPAPLEYFGMFIHLVYK